jgi:hypothetical protein
LNESQPGRHRQDICLTENNPTAAFLLIGFSRISDKTIALDQRSPLEVAPCNSQWFCDSEKYELEALVLMLRHTAYICRFTLKNTSSKRQRVSRVCLKSNLQIAVREPAIPLLAQRACMNGATSKSASE